MSSNDVPTVILFEICFYINYLNIKLYTIKAKTRNKIIQKRCLLNKYNIVVRFNHKINKPNAKMCESKVISLTSKREEVDKH